MTNISDQRPLSLVFPRYVAHAIPTPNAIIFVDSPGRSSKRDHLYASATASKYWRQRGRGMRAGWSLGFSSFSRDLSRIRYITDRSFWSRHYGGESVRFSFYTIRRVATRRSNVDIPAKYIYNGRTRCYRFAHATYRTDQPEQGADDGLLIKYRTFWIYIVYVRNKT